MSELGICDNDIISAAAIGNSAERRLITAPEAGDEGWWGSWAEIAFNVSQSFPYVTMPRNVARAEAFAICDCPVQLNNQFFEYLRFGNGRLPKIFANECHRMLQVMSRNNAPGFQDLTNPPQFIVVYPTNPADLGFRVLIQGRDPSGQTIFTQDNLAQVKGVFVTLTLPSATAQVNGVNQPFSIITGYQKDITKGPVQIFQMDPVTGAQVLLHTMQPSETTGWYRRYFFNALPFDCCTAMGPPSGCPAGVTPGQVQVTAIVKLDPIPVQYDTDYFTLQNLEALIEESISLRYNPMDIAQAKNFRLIHHKEAIGLLNGELAHYLGKNEPAVDFAPWGTARLGRQKIGSLI
jgi:hypothetical protein